MIILLFFKVVLQSVFAVYKQPRLLLYIMCFAFTIGMGWLYLSFSWGFMVRLFMCVRRSIPP